MSEDKFRSDLHQIFKKSYPNFPIVRVLFSMLKYGKSHFPQEYLFEGRLFALGKRSLVIRMILYKFGLLKFTDPSPYFSSNFYELSNNDVSSTGVKPWLHFVVYGLFEGRAPHPLLDLRFLRDQIPGLSYPSTLYNYLVDLNYWDYQPSPFVDFDKYLAARGPHPGIHPLKLMLSEGTTSSWISPRLAAIQVDSTHEQTEELLVLIRALFLNNQYSNWASTFDIYEKLTSGDIYEIGNRIHISAGHFIAGSGKFKRLSKVVFSKDFQAVVSDNFAVTLRPSSSISCLDLVVLLNETDAGGYLALFENVKPGSLILPFSELQEMALKYLLKVSDRTDINVAEYGRLYSVTYSGNYEQISFTIPLIQEQLLDGAFSPLSNFQDALLVIHSSEFETEFEEEFINLFEHSQILIIYPDSPLESLLRISESSKIVYTEKTEQFIRSVVPINPIYSIESMKQTSKNREL